MFKEYLDHYKMRESFIEALKGVRRLSITDKEASIMLQDSIDAFYTQYLKANNLDYNQKQKEKDLLSILEE